jgi:hypothetical protein
MGAVADLSVRSDPPGGERERERGEDEGPEGGRGRKRERERDPSQKKPYCDKIEDKGDPVVQVDLDFLITLSPGFLCPFFPSKS